MTALKAKQMGLVMAIAQGRAEVDAATRLQLVACGAPHIPEKTKTDTNMELQKQLEQLLGTEGSDNLIASVKALQQEKGYKAKYEALEATVKADKKKEADGIIAQLKDKKW